jgi:hypothetical protein
LLRSATGDTASSPRLASERREMVSELFVFVLKLDNPPALGHEIGSQCAQRAPDASSPIGVSDLAGDLIDSLMVGHVAKASQSHASPATWRAFLSVGVWPPLSGVCLCTAGGGGVGTPITHRRTLLLTRDAATTVTSVQPPEPGGSWP